MVNKISVIIPCHNEQATLGESIKSFMGQSLSPFEIIVVDDFSEDNSVEIAKSEKVILVKNRKNLGPAGSRNAGAKIAKGDILVFAEADGKYSLNYLEEAIKPLSDKAVGGVLSGRRIVWTDKNSIFVRYQNLKWETVEQLMDSGRREIIGAWVFRRAVFNELGGYDNQYRIGEDIELINRIKKRGYKIVWVKGTYFHHRDPDTLDKFILDKSRRKARANLAFKTKTFSIKTKLRLFFGAIEKAAMRGEIVLALYTLVFPITYLSRKILLKISGKI